LYGHDARAPALDAANSPLATHLPSVRVIHETPLNPNLQG
jgi:hypothetical protein